MRNYIIKRRDELIDELLKDYKKPEDIIGENGLLKELTKASLEQFITYPPFRLR